MWRIAFGRFAIAKRHLECHCVQMNASTYGTTGAIYAGQVRAARALLGWTLDQLVAQSRVPKRTLIRFEGGVGAARMSTVTAIRATLEAAGVEFIAENGGGPGVRLMREANPAKCKAQHQQDTASRLEEGQPCQPDPPNTGRQGQRKLPRTQRK